MTATYLGYVAGGVTRDTHAPLIGADGTYTKPYRVPKQFWVQEELRRKGITAWCGKRVEFKRLGKDREWTRFDVPALPNYIILELDHAQMFDAITVDHLSPTLAIVPRAEVQQVKDFIGAVEAEFATAERVDQNSRASVTEYNKGQTLRVISGPLQDMLVTFDSLVRAPHDRWPRLQAETETGLRVQFDPLDVRRA